MKKSLIKFGYLFSFFRRAFYNFTMAATKRLKKNVVVVKYNNMELIPKRMKKGSLYKRDIVLGLRGDYLYHPRAIEANISDGIKMGDCDDHAIYWATALKKSHMATEVYFAYYSMYGKSTLDGKEDYSAHALCVFKGASGLYYWADYSDPNPIDSIEDFMEESAKKFGKKPIAGVTWEVTEIKDDDTPVFGKAQRRLPKHQD